MDKDTEMLQVMGTSIVSLQVKYRNSTLSDRMALRPVLEELLNDYTDYQIRLLKEGVISTDDDLKEMIEIKKEIDKAAEKDALLKAIARTIAFVATKV